MVASKMNKLAITATVLASACATGRTIVAEHDAPTPARVHLALARQADTAAVFPTAIAPTLPRVDRIGREVRGTLGDRATAAIDLCVSAAGNVTKVALVESSSFAQFDKALLADLERWQFAAMPGPDSLQTCERAKITYRPY